ncbi:hypothetical protein ABUE31_02350 [Mesorhizobium sp. ZMM04-5]|uniref:PepSY domain-containing protein n=1 Tax=Mesorhizobium marinum TaxID=3228790 RepID=A0ABV3QUS1_9HYPH
MKRKLAMALSLIALPALADTPDDILDLLGARAAGAETQMQARGYAEAGSGNIWWNEKTGICVKVQVSQGRYKAIDMLPDRDCGRKAAEQSDAAAPRSPSQAAMDACMNGADDYQEVADGSSIVKHARRSGENWILTMDTSGRTSHCTVTQAGDVIGME